MVGPQEIASPSFDIGFPWPVCLACASLVDDHGVWEIEGNPWLVEAMTLLMPLAPIPSLEISSRSCPPLTKLPTLGETLNPA
jgi:hypothetical protein